VRQFGWQIGAARTSAKSGSEDPAPIVAQLLALAVGPPVGAGPVAQGGHAFQRHVAGALDRPFVVLLHQDRSDEGDDDVVVGKDSEDLGPSFDLASEPFETGAEVRLRGVGPWRMVQPSGTEAAGAGRCGQADLFHEL
jgi:hypothetical protein